MDGPHFSLLFGFAVLAVRFAEAPIRLWRELLLSEAAVEQRPGDRLDGGDFAGDVDLPVALRPGDVADGVEQAGCAVLPGQPGDAVRFRAFAGPVFTVARSIDLDQGPDRDGGGFHHGHGHRCSGLVADKAVPAGSFAQADLAPRSGYLDGVSRLDGARPAHAGTVAVKDDVE